LIHFFKRISDLKEDVMSDKYRHKSHSARDPET